MTKEEILNRSENGLLVFRHFVHGNWKVGKNFLNPFYEDKKASCNVYFDKKSGIYKIKDFGDSRFNGDYFQLVATLNHLQTNDREDFKKVLQIISKELFFGNDSNPIERKTTYMKEENPSKFEIKTKDFSNTEIDFWSQYGIDSSTLKKYEVLSLASYTSTNKEGKEYTINGSAKEPIFGYKQGKFIKVYRPFSELRFQFLGQKPDTYIFGLYHLPARGDILFITGGEKDVLTLSANGFYAICFNSENVTIPSEVIQKLSYRFRHIVLLYDVDKAGLDAVTNHQRQLKDFDIKVMLLPLEGTKKEKDISDFFKLGNTANDLRNLFHQLLESIYSQTFAILKSCEIDFKNPPTTPQPIVTISGVTIGSQGNLLGITGNEGSGKSNFLGGMLAGAMASKNQKVDSLGTQVLSNYYGKAILYFDTEQSEDQLYSNLTYILKRSNRSSPPDWFRAYCLTNLSRKERLQVIIQSVDKFHHEFGGVHIVVIDGIGDLIGSLNDERESIHLIEELHRMAGIYQTCIACVLHLIPSGVKLRGHLGSELQRKAAGILCIEKDENSDVSCIKALKVRSGSPLDVPLIEFAWEKEKGYHVFVGEKSKDYKIKRKVNDLSIVVQEIMRDLTFISYTDLWTKLIEEMDVSERTAKGYIRFMLDNQMLLQSETDKLLRLKK